MDKYSFTWWTENSFCSIFITFIIGTKICLKSIVHTYGKWTTTSTPTTTSFNYRYEEKQTNKFIKTSIELFTLIIRISIDHTTRTIWCYSWSFFTTIRSRTIITLNWWLCRNTRYCCYGCSYSRSRNLMKIFVGFFFIINFILPVPPVSIASAPYLLHSSDEQKYAVRPSYSSIFPGDPQFDVQHLRMTISK